jgi:hypothetical protein
MNPTACLWPLTGVGLPLKGECDCNPTVLPHHCRSPSHLSPARRRHISQKPFAARQKVLQSVQTGGWLARPDLVPRRANASEPSGWEVTVVSPDYLDYFWTPKTTEQFKTRLDITRESKRPGWVSAMLYPYQADGVHTVPFQLPKVGAPEPVKVPLEQGYGNHVLGFRFLGGGYVTVDVPKALLYWLHSDYMHRQPMNAAPEVFTFGGQEGDFDLYYAEKERLNVHRNSVGLGGL